jgi:hypothetical protein
MDGRKACFFGKGDVVFNGTVGEFEVFDGDDIAAGIGGATVIDEQCFLTEVREEFGGLAVQFLGGGGHGYGLFFLRGRRCKEKTKGKG